jgi:restriction system protein
MLPFLKSVSDKKEHNMREILGTLAAQFNLSEVEQKELLLSGLQPIFENRVGWTRTYLKKAGLLGSPRRAVVVITDRGIDILRQNPEKINIKFLRQFPEFVEFHTAKKDEGTQEDSVEENASPQTPEEAIESAYQGIRKALAQELLNKILEMPPSFFERLVVELLVKMGYGGSIKDAGRAFVKSGDGGIDGTIKEDKLGLDLIHIQAKRWQSSNVVSRPEIQKFVGALDMRRSKRGIFITTSTFSSEAWEYISHIETKIALIDGEQLSQLMIDHNLGVSPQQTYELKRIDNDYFEEE